MTVFSSMGSRLLALALTVSLALPASAALAAPTVKDSTASTSRTAEMTERDVAASNAKIRMAYSDLASMWANGLARMHERFAVPQLLRYRGAARSACGIMQPNNAAYCPNENAIYYDEVFVAAQAKAAALELGTDGDMAGIGVIAHEMGHAVAMQLGYDAPVRTTTKPRPTVWPVPSHNTPTTMARSRRATWTRRSSAWPRPRTPRRS